MDSIYGFWICVIASLMNGMLFYTSTPAFGTWLLFWMEKREYGKDIGQQHIFICIYVAW